MNFLVIEVILSVTIIYTVEDVMILWVAVFLTPHPTIHLSPTIWV